MQRREKEKSKVLLAFSAVNNTNSAKMSDSDEQPQESTGRDPQAGSESRPATPSSKKNNQNGPRINNIASTFKRSATNSTSHDSNSISGSMRKRIVLNKQIISVQKEDGDIGHIEVNIDDEEFTTQQPILQSLAEMGEIMKTSKPASPVPGKGSLKDVLRRGSMAVGAAVAPAEQKINVPQGKSLTYTVL